MKICFIVNPVAGKSSTRAGRCERIEALMAQMGIEAEIQVTTRRLHARELAHAAVEDGCDRVVSVGGDGTMNEVASVLVNTGVALALVPLGSGNGLARNLGIPLDFGRAVETAVSGIVRTIDSGRVNGKAFFNVMGIGFDADLGVRFNRSRHRGFFSYLLLGVSAFFGYRMKRYSIDVSGDGPLVLEAFVLSVANSTQYGNGAHIAPSARVDDGRLDLVAVTTSNAVRLACLVVQLFAGSIERSRYFMTVPSERFKVTRASAGPVHTDGEIHQMDTMLEIETVPGSISVVVPPGGV